MRYTHISLEEREKLYSLREQGKTFREIASELGRDQSTWSREYKRNAQYGKPYVPCKADKQTKKRAADQRYQAPLKNPLVFLYVRNKLRKKWSPETIAGRLSLDHPGKSISYETIYRYIYNSKKTRGMKLYRYLKLHRKRRMKKNGRKVKREKIIDAVRIDQRPEVIEERNVVGHWETDNMGGKQKDTSSFAATVERKTRYTLLDLVKDRTAETRNHQLAGRLKAIPKQLKQTLTVDNGAENAKHKQLSRQTGMDIYFCNPYSSWEKGTVENRIGRVRDFISKGTSIDTLTQKQVRAIEHYLNHKPMKCLGWKTPHEAMMIELQALENTEHGALQV